MYLNSRPAKLRQSVPICERTAAVDAQHIFLAGVVGAFGLFAVTLFVVALRVNGKN
jgi:hypothetical protein